jgi:Glycosyl hydrolase family 10
MLFGNNVLGPMPPTNPIRIWDAGVQWCDLEKKKGEWDWTKLDSLVAAAGTRSIMLVLGHPPAWAAKGGPDGRQASWMPAGSNRPPIDLPTFRRYVEAVVTRYKGRITLYQVWNEPADKRFYSGSLTEIGTITKAAYQVIKRVDKKARVVSPPLQPRRQAKWATKGRAIRKSLADAGYPFDVWAAHIYPQQEEGVEGFIRDCRMVKEAIAPTKKPLWITETNYNIGGVGNPYPVSRQIALKAATKKACVLLDIPRCYWYAYQYSNQKMIAITHT